MADVKAAVKKRRVYLDPPVSVDMQQWNVPISKLLDAIEHLTEKDFRKTHHYTDEKNHVRNGHFDDYAIRRSHISPRGILLEKDDDYLKFKLVTTPTGDLIIVISYHPSGH